jgi:hypothetical protein
VPRSSTRARDQRAPAAQAVADPAGERHRDREHQDGRRGAPARPGSTGAEVGVICRSGTLTMLLLIVPSTVAPSRAASSQRARAGGDMEGRAEARPRRRADPVVVSGTVVLSLLPNE